MRIVDCIQGTEQWAEARRGIPTASCADKIITPAKGELSKSAIDYACFLVAESIVPAYYWRDESFVSSAMADGTLTEREARDYFAMLRGCEVQQVGFVTTDDGRYGASPDGILANDEGLELKCPKHKTHIRYLVDGVLPDEYKPQVHWSLCVTRFKAWNFMSYAVGLPPLIVRVTPDEYTVKVAEAMEKFSTLLASVRDKVLAGEPSRLNVEPQESYF